MFFMAVVNYQTQCRHRHRRIKENFESSNVIYCCHKKAVVPLVLFSSLHNSGEEVHQLVLSVEVCIESQVLITTAHIGTLSTLPVRWQSARHSADQVGLELVVSYSVSFSLLVSFASS